jgi:uncharacterized protein YjbI with pentapeptide repeats
MAGAHFTGWLDRADFRWADLARATFGAREAKSAAQFAARMSLVGCDFSEATLREASLAGASLAFARFVDADLRGADFSGADLTRADFAGADLAGANMAGANLDEANFAGARGFGEMRGFALARNADRVLGR